MRNSAAAASTWRQSSTASTYLSDIFPTLCAIAGLPTPKTVQGRDFSPLFEDPKKPFREVAYSRYLIADALIAPDFTYTSYKDGKSQMLYDLRKDPNENINVANDPEYSETLKQMAELLNQRKEEAARYRKPVK